MNPPKNLELMMTAALKPALVASDPEKTVILALTEREAALVNAGAHLTRCLFPDYVDDVYDLLAKLFAAGHVQGFLSHTTDQDVRDLGIDFPDGEGE